VYQDVEKLYIAGEAAKAVELYGDHFEILVRDHQEMTGGLGSMLPHAPMLYSRYDPIAGASVDILVRVPRHSFF
jgi:hypothetical protein